MNEYAPPPPTEAKNEYGPYLSMIVVICVAASVTASSHEIASHLLLPRSPASFSG